MMRHMSNNLRRLFLAVCVLFAPASALAQSDSAEFELGGQFAIAKSSEFDAVDLGFGGRFAWLPGDVLGLESEFNFYSNGFPSAFPFTHRRTEGLFGATVGPTLGPVRPFGKARAGFLNIKGAPEAIICLLIFPPPIACELETGRTLPVFDLGGGFELLSSRVFSRFDIGDRLIRYPGPVLSRRGVRDDAFFSHDLRLGAGAGVRF